MKTSTPSKHTDRVLNTLAAKLRLKRLKVQRLRGTLLHLEAECERLEAETLRRAS